MVLSDPALFMVLAVTDAQGQRQLLELLYRVGRVTVTQQLMS